MGRTQIEYADEISSELGIGVRKGRLFIQRLLELVGDDLVKTGRVELRGLGIFAVHIRPKRRAKHPKTGVPILIPAKKAIRYRSSIALRRRLNPPKASQKRSKS